MATRGEGDSGRMDGVLLAVSAAWRANRICASASWS
jgi:hypothetical protein